MKSKLLCLCMCIVTAKVTCNDLENTDDVSYKEISPSNISTIPEVAVEFLSSTEKTIPFTNSSLASNLKINTSEQAQTASPVSSTSIPRTYNPDDNTNKLNNETSSEVEDYKSTNQLVTKSSSLISEIKNSTVVQGNAEVLHTENANASTMENLQTAELVQPKVTPTKNTNSQVDQHRDHDHRALGQSGFIQPSESAAILASVFVGVAIIGYAGLVVWRKILEKKYGNREMLVNEEDFSAGNDLRYFEL